MSADTMDVDTTNVDTMSPDMMDADTTHADTIKADAMNDERRMPSRSGLPRLGALLLGLLAAPVTAPAQAPECDRDCLEDLATQYIDALRAQDPSGLPWAERVRFTENEVPLMIGDGLWGTATRIEAPELVLAEPATGNVLWYGIVEEHGEPAYLGLRLGVEGRAIADVETVLGRDGPPAPYAAPDGYSLDAAFTETLPEPRRRPRARLVALVEGYYDTLQLNDGTLLGKLAEGCRRVTNGVSTTHGDDVAVEGCRRQLEIGLHQHVDSVRARRYPIVDEARGLVVALAFLDHAVRYTSYRTTDGEQRSVPVEYPNSHGVLEIFKVDDGEVTHIEGITAFQPYLMPTIWAP